MRVELISCTPLSIAEEAGRICVGRKGKPLGEPNMEYLLGLVRAGHESVIEHIYYTFRIEGISRALLQQLARHRHTSMSVKSTRWCLGKHTEFYIPEELTPEEENEYRDSVHGSMRAASLMAQKYGNDVGKYLMPECTLTDLIFTANLRELRHIYRVRSDKRAMAEFRYLCWIMSRELLGGHFRLLTEGFNPDEPAELTVNSMPIKEENENA